MFFVSTFTDKKEKWVPVEIPIIPPKRGNGNGSGAVITSGNKSSSRPHSRTADKSKNWREDTKGKNNFAEIILNPVPAWIIQWGSE